MALSDKDKLKYLIAIRRDHTIANICNTFELILLYWLGYLTAFWILLAIGILCDFGFYHIVKEKEEELNIKR